MPGEDPHNRTGNPRGHVTRLFDSRDQVVPIGRQEQRRYANVVESISDVVPGQHLQARDVAVAARLSGQIQEAPEFLSVCMGGVEAERREPANQSHGPPGHRTQPVHGEMQSELRGKVRERIHHDERTDPIGLGEREAERERSSERLTDHDRPALDGCHRIDHAGQIGDENVHRRDISQRVCAHPVGTREPGYLTVEQLARAVHAGHEHNRIARPLNRQTRIVLVGPTMHRMLWDMDHAIRRIRVWGRVAWTVVTLCIVQGLVCGVSALPVVLFWSGLARWTTASSPLVRALLFSGSAIPSYILFALCLMVLSAFSTRLTGWRTVPGLQLRISDFDWPALNWSRYMVAIHLVRVLAGTVFRGSPLWTMYLRLNGARMGRRVYVNSLSVSDHNLLDFGDDVVIGADVHISGHTVEGGIVRTGTVRLGHDVTIGLGSVIEIDVEAGPHCQVGAMSLVPKHTKLKGGALYVGIPAKIVG